MRIGPALVAMLTLAMSDTARAEAPPPPPSAALNAQLVAGIVSLSVGVAAAGVAIGSAVRTLQLRQDEGFINYRTAVLVDENACELAAAGHQPVPPAGAPAGAIPPAAEIAELCGEARTFEILQAVTWPLAFVGTTVGIVLVSTSDDKESARSIRLRPVVGLGGASLSLEARF